MSGVVLLLSAEIPRHKGDLILIARGVLPVAEVDAHRCQGNVVVAHLDLLEADDSAFLGEVEEKRGLAFVTLTNNHQLDTTVRLGTVVRERENEKQRERERQRER